MKKIGTVVLTLVLLLAMLPIQGYSAQVKITEMTGLKLIVNGKALNPGAAILNVNGAVLVPLKEFMTGIGVPADSSHIKWDSKKKKAVVSWNGLSVTFKAGSKSAVAGGKTVGMDAYCISYARNKKVYVPLKFTAQLFGFVIASDDTVKTIYVREGSTFKRNMERLKAIDEAMAKLSRVKIKTGMKVNLSSTATKADFNVDSLDELDRQNKKMHSLVNIPVFGTSMTLETFFFNGSVYTRNSSVAGWDITKLSDEDYTRLLDEPVSLSMINNSDVLAAAMEEAPGCGSGKTVLKGITYPGRLIESITADAEFGSLEPETYCVQAGINEASGLIERLHIEVKGACFASKSFTRAELVIDMDYLEPDGSFQVIAPQ